MYHFKAKDSELNTYPLCLGNIPKDFTADNMKKMDYMDLCMIFQLIIIALMLMTF